ncbi:hypothetical protein [Actinopolyspora mortivallis]|uniref:Uncharacterized protein n=1 Tax=Actinopolyspora mortivallis TaxID=33906 RepID=A0A2T0GXB3_ACTMO|nr:hypothetical protein [Actinopolyspora mortivallis]PRW63663.1 hypothetical protein CEP50_09370 [Actinopolyspora mortivallis]
MTTDARGRTPDTDTDPRSDPSGTVRVHPADHPSDPRARRIIKTADGRWHALTHPEPNTSEPRAEALRDWPPQPLAELARVLCVSSDGSSPTVPAPRDEHPEPERGSDRTGTPPKRARTPTFWEVAKAYCRAFLRTDERLEQYERGRLPGC